MKREPALRTARRSALFAALLGSAFASQAADYATVVSSTPVTVPMLSLIHISEPTRPY